MNLTTTRKKLGLVKSLSPDFGVYNCDEECPTEQPLFWANNISILSADCEAEANETAVCSCHRPYIAPGCEHAFSPNPTVFLVVSYIYFLAFLYLATYGFDIIRRKTLKLRTKDRPAICCVCNRGILGIWGTTLAIIGRALYVGLDPQHFYLLLPEWLYTSILHFPVYLICIAFMLVFESWLSFIALNTNIKQKCSARQREVGLYVSTGFVGLIGVTHILTVILPEVFSPSVRDTVENVSTQAVNVLATVLALIFLVSGCLFSRQLKLTHWQNERLRQISELSFRCLVGYSVIVLVFNISVPLYLFGVGKTLIGWAVGNLIFRTCDVGATFLLLRLFEAENISKFGIQVWIRMCCKDRNGSNKGKPMKRKPTKRTREKKANKTEPSKQISGPSETPTVEEKKEVSYEVEMPVVTASTTEEASASQTTHHSPDNNTSKSFKKNSPMNGFGKSFKKSSPRNSFGKSFKKSSPRNSVGKSFKKSSPKRNSLAKVFRLSTPKNRSPSTSHLLADHLMEDEEESESPPALPSPPAVDTSPDVQIAKRSLRLSASQLDRPPNTFPKRRGTPQRIGSPNRSPNRTPSSTRPSSTRNSGKVFNFDEEDINSANPSTEEPSTDAKTDSLT